MSRVNRKTQRLKYNMYRITMRELLVNNTIIDWLRYCIDSFHQTNIIVLL